MTDIISYDKAGSAILAQLSNILDRIRDTNSLADMTKARSYVESLRYAAQEARVTLDIQNEVAETKLRIERRLGESIASIDRQQGRRSDLETLSQPATKLFQEVLDEAGINKDNAARWQKIAALPDAQFEHYIAVTKDERAELTTAGVLRFEREIARAAVVEQMRDAPPLPNGKYRVFYADPPWSYGNSGVIGPTDNYGHVHRHYPSMSIDELCALGPDIRGMAEDNAVLFMWVTSPLLEECFAVIRAWGFQYKTSFIWDKVKHNFGHYNSVRHELLLICTRGSCTPDNPTLYDSVQSIERSDKHSEKPDEFRQIVDSLYQHGQRIELFARSSAEGWETWGNQT